MGRINKTKNFTFGFLDINPTRLLTNVTPIKNGQDNATENNKAQINPFL